MAQSIVLKLIRFLTAYLCANESLLAYMVKHELQQKAFSPILITLSGIKMLVRVLQSLKVPSKMLVTVLGMVTLIRLSLQAL